MTKEEAAGTPRVRILIAEDQALVRRGTTVLLSMEQDMEVVGQACDGVEAVAMAAQLRPDVVLMDLHMPRLGGVAATREITRTLPGTKAWALLFQRILWLKSLTSLSRPPTRLSAAPSALPSVRRPALP